MIKRFLVKTNCYSQFNYPKQQSISPFYSKTRGDYGKCIFLAASAFYSTILKTKTCIKKQSSEPRIQNTTYAYKMPILSSRQMQIIALIVRFCLAPMTLVYISTVFLLILSSAQDQLAGTTAPKKINDTLDVDNH